MSTCDFSGSFRYSFSPESAALSPEEDAVLKSSKLQKCFTFFILMAHHDLVHGVGVCGDAVGVLVDGVYVVLVGVVVVVVQVVVHIRHQAAVRDQS
jgi:hypothetical protein